MESKKISKQKISDHILQTSSNLLGLCFLILSLVKISKIDPSTILDEFLVLPILLFFSSSILSYMSLRSGRESDFYENLADKIFIGGLISITIISLVFVFEIIV